MGCFWLRLYHNGLEWLQRKGISKSCQRKHNTEHFLFFLGGGQDGTKKQQLLEICPKCQVCLYMRIAMFTFLVYMFLVVVNFCSRHDHIYGLQLWRGKGGGSAFQPWGDGP